MPAFKFIHCSDLHLGRRYANIPQPPDGNIRGRLMEARHGAIERIGAAAEAHGAEHVLVAGDTFDTATPSPTVLRQALGAMAARPGLHWWLLPGNHDNLRDAEPLWDTILRDAPANVHALTEGAPVALRAGVTLLPCPVPVRSPGRDLTETLPGMASPAGDLRIGLAHGGIVDFTESGESIPPDRDVSAALDYLALGDWHGRMAVGPRVHYCGTPEQDRFKHDRFGMALAVTIDAAGVLPSIDEIEIGQFAWRSHELTLYQEQDAAAALAAILPDDRRRDTLVKVSLSGWTGLAQHAALLAEVARVAPEFAHFELRDGDLGLTHEASDLDEIARGGALRGAAATLRDEGANAALSQEDRDVSSAALARLYSYVKDSAE